METFMNLVTLLNSAMDNEVSSQIWQLCRIPHFLEPAWSSQHPCFQVYFDCLIPQWTYFLLVRKIRPFLHEKVVIMQSDACRWFYAPIYAKWLLLRRKSNRNFRGNFLKKHFQAPKILLKSPKLIGQKSLSYERLFERQKTEVYIFEMANLSGFATYEFNSKEDLNPRKQVLLLKLRLCPTQKPKLWSMFFGKKFIWENSVV